MSEAITIRLPKAPDLHQITDDLIREGVDAAIQQNLLPAARETAYPGHFDIVAGAEGFGGFGGEATWPGLDSWQLAGAYLLLGRRRLVLDYFDFISASQRADGNIPFAIFPAEPAPKAEACLRMLRDPQDTFVYEPCHRDGRPTHAHWQTRRWIGLFEHWQPMANPLRLLGAVSYLLTAHEIFADESDLDWLRPKLASLERAAEWLLSRRRDNGLISGSGYYVELPPRYEFDGVAQCYVAHAWRKLSGLLLASGMIERHDFWAARADELSSRFREMFWRDDHFIESIHPQRGPVDSHGLSDVNWAAIAFELANDRQTNLAMSRMLDEPRLWRGGMPSQLVADPFSYEEWELNEPLPFDLPHGRLCDAAAMGRVWYLETLACMNTGHTQRLRDSTRLVCEMGRRHNWRWHERYCPQPDDTVRPLSTTPGYLEYPAILVRTAMSSDILL